MYASLLALAFAFADEPAKVAEGKPAPDFTLTAATANGSKEVHLKDLKGKNVVLFFYPKAMTSGCTKESCAFSNLLKKFEETDTIVYGISTDKVDAQTKFIEKEKLGIPLLADPEQKVTKEYGSLRPTGGLANRDTFVIDKEGNVKKIYRGVKNAGDHPEEVLKYVQENLGKK